MDYCCKKKINELTGGISIISKIRKKFEKQTLLNFDDTNTNQFYKSCIDYFNFFSRIIVNIKI